jgi:hypothetical protein
LHSLLLGSPSWIVSATNRPRRANVFSPLCLRSRSSRSSREPSTSAFARESDNAALPLFAQWTSPDTIGADELFWRGVLDPRDRALDQALVGSRD